MRWLLIAPVLLATLTLTVSADPVVRVPPPAGRVARLGVPRWAGRPAAGRFTSAGGVRVAAADPATLRWLGGRTDDAEWRVASEPQSGIAAIDVADGRIAIAVSAGVLLRERGVWRRLVSAPDVQRVALTPDGRWIAVASQTALWCGPVEGSLARRPLDGPVRLAWSADGTRLAVADVTGVTLWQLPGMTRLTRLTAPPRPGPRLLRSLGPPLPPPALVPPAPPLVALSADGAQVAIARRTRLMRYELDGERVARRLDVTAHSQRFHRISGSGIGDGLYETGGLTALAFAPGGRLASAGRDGRLRLWAPGRTTPVETLRLPLPDVTRLAFTPDGRRLLVVSPGLRFAVRDLAARTWPFVTPDHPGPVTVLAVSADGTTLASACARRIQVWDLASGQVLGRLDAHGTTSLAVGPRGRWVAAGWSHGLRRWRRGPSGWTAGPSRSAGSGGVAVAALPGGRLAVVDEHHYRVLDAAGRVTGRHPLARRSYPQVRVAPDGLHLVRWGGGGVDWRSATGALRAGAPGAGPVAVGPAGWVAIAGRGVLRLTEVGSGLELRRFALRERRVVALAFSTTGAALAVAYDDGVALHETRSGRPLGRLASGPTGDAVFVPGRDRLLSACGDGTVLVWDVGHVTGRARPLPPRLPAVRLAAFWSRPGPRGRAIGCGPLRLRAVVRREPRGLGVFDLDGQRLAHLPGLGLPPRHHGMWISPDRGILVSHHRAYQPDQHLTLWDLGGGKAPVRITPTPTVLTQLVFATSDRFVTLSGTDRLAWAVELWSTSGERLAVLWRGPGRRRPRELAVSADGRRLAAGLPGRAIVVWDLPDGTVHRELAAGRAHYVERREPGLAFSADGTRLVERLDAGKRIHVWELATGRPLADARGWPSPAGSLSFDDSGSRHVLHREGLPSIRLPGRVSGFGPGDATVRAGGRWFGLTPMWRALR